MICYATMIILQMKWQNYLLQKFSGQAVLKLQYGDVFYAVLPTKKSDIFKVQTQKGARYIRYENFDDLKEAIQEANK